MSSASECPYPLETCRCKAQFFWAITENLKRIPVNPQPDETRGNLQLLHGEFEDQPRVRVLSVAQRFGKTGLYLSHFADCPLAEKYRGRQSTRRRP